MEIVKDDREYQKGENMDKFEGITFKELQDNIIEKGGAEGDRIIKIIKQHKETMKELCDLCRKTHEEHDSRGFIYFHGEGQLKAGWECVEKLVRREKLKREIMED